MEVSLTSDQEFFAINEEQTLHAELSTEDIDECLHTEKVFICPHHRVLYKVAYPTCLLALFQSQLKLAKTLCRQTVQRRKTMKVYQVSDDRFNLIAVNDSSLQIQCQEPPTTEAITIRKGSSVIRLPYGCSATTKELYIPRSLQPTIQPITMTYPLQPIPPMPISEFWKSEDQTQEEVDLMVDVANVLTSITTETISLDQVRAATMALRTINGSNGLFELPDLSKFEITLPHIELPSVSSVMGFSFKDLLFDILFMLIGLCIGTLTIIIAFNVIRRKVGYLQATMIETLDRLTGNEPDHDPPPYSHPPEYPDNTTAAASPSRSPSPPPHDEPELELDHPSQASAPTRPQSPTEHMVLLQYNNPRPIAVPRLSHTNPFNALRRLSQPTPPVLDPMPPIPNSD